MTFTGLLVLASGLFLVTLASAPAVSRRLRGRSDTKLLGGIHYSWVIVAILAITQVISGSITMAAGIMVPLLNDADGSFGYHP